MLEFCSYRLIQTNFNEFLKGHIPDINSINNVTDRNIQCDNREMIINNLVYI